jgi:Zn-dependent protease
MKCQACQTETALPFICPYCGGQFCATHRLPENHACPKIATAREQTQSQVLNNQNYANYNYSYVYGQQRKRPITTSPKELKHIGIAAALVIGIGVSMALYGIYWDTFVTSGLDSLEWVAVFAFAAVMTVSFLVHEIAHKIMAQRAGMWAEFRLTTWGAVLTFASVFLPFKMIAPGAMMIGGATPSAKDMLKISVAGGITNLIFAITFFTLTFTLPISVFNGGLLFSAYINAFMAAFNMVPCGVLDGFKVFSINKKVWAALFVPSAILAVAIYLIMIGVLVF